jgi:hypothetical protein
MSDQVPATTTHAMVEKRCFKTSFSDTKILWFQGQPRQVKIWDEAILPGHPVTLGRDSLASLFETLRPRHPEFTKALERFFNELGDTKDKTFLDVPDLHVSFGMPFHEVSGLFVHQGSGARAVEIGVAQSPAWLGYGVRRQRQSSPGSMRFWEASSSRRPCAW